MSTADLATSGWIRQQYHGSLQYPVSVISLSTMYLRWVREQWEFSCNQNRTATHIENDACIALSRCDQNRTVTHICPSINHQHIFICGAMIVSTRGGHHQWIMKVNNFSKRLMFGISNCRISGETQAKYHAMIFKKNSFSRYSFVAFSRNGAGIYKQTFGLATEYERMQNGDVVIMKLRGNHVEIRDIRGDCKSGIRMRIDDGPWRAFIGLGGIGDSVSIISYSQTDTKQKCVGKIDSGWCEQELQSNWNHCPNCRIKI